jgi:hypothetical protein
VEFLNLPLTTPIGAIKQEIARRHTKGFQYHTRDLQLIVGHQIPSHLSSITITTTTSSSKVSINEDKRVPPRSLHDSWTIGRSKLTSGSFIYVVILAHTTAAMSARTCMIRLVLFDLPCRYDDRCGTLLDVHATNV